MAISTTLQDYLETSGISYDLVSHSYTTSSMATAESSHISAHNIAKSVILEDDSGYLMAVIPATRHIKLGKLSRIMKRRLGLATEKELTSLFYDCDTGAIPPIGQAYNMDVVVDNRLKDCDDVYFEAGDHTDLVHVHGGDFLKLMQHAQYSHFS